jgi:hypothetical protein
MAGIWTQADVDTLKAAVASGVLTVRYSGPPERMVTYQDLAEMRKLLAEMVGAVGRTSSGRPGFIVANTRKGH